jgi:hypothetical protein
MKPNQALLVCETVLARLDAALEVAGREVKSASAAEKQIRSLVSRLLTEQGPDANVPEHRLLGVSRAMTPAQPPIATRLTRQAAHYDQMG